MNPRVLVVSEDPLVIHHAFSVLRPYGVKVTGCLGPAMGPCALETSDTCPLAEHSSVIVIDAPPSGSFTCHEKIVPAADYAAEIAERHPSCFPILCGAPEARSGPTGDTAQATNAYSAIEMLRQVARASYAAEDDLDAATEEGVRT
jgi:hypothetical protein